MILSNFETWSLYQVSFFNQYAVRNFFFIILLFLFVFSINAQQTVGLFHSSDSAYSGYTLFAPSRSEITYLIDNCGNLQYTWHSPYRAAGSSELQENGLLIRSCKYPNGSPINGGGAGGKIMAIQPDLLVAWELDIANDTNRQHHDFTILPNGNIITIVWELRSEQQAIHYGRDSSLVSASGLWPDYLIEYNPISDSIVWEWHAWDHVIQDYDSTMPNFGVIAEHPELLNLNFSGNGDNPDWLHLNSLDYNDQLDQLLFSSPNWNEIFIIDHSTTTLEAAGHSGGNSGIGGDILWRWGNPITYGAGDSTNQVFYFQHDAHWITQGYPDEQKIIVFNNGKGKQPYEFSSVDIINPMIHPTGLYGMSVDGSFLPASVHYSYTAPNPTDFFGRIISSAEQLPNGNLLIDEGTKGHFFEVDSLGNIVWDYVNPVVSDSILTQGQTIPGTSNLFNSCFRARRYGATFSGLTFLPMSNQGPIELNPYTNTCAVGTNDFEHAEMTLFPNPTNNYFSIQPIPLNCSMYLSNAMGQQLMYKQNIPELINVSELDLGIYFITIINNDSSNRVVWKLIKS